MIHRIDFRSEPAAGQYAYFSSRVTIVSSKSPRIDLVIDEIWEIA